MNVMLLGAGRLFQQAVRTLMEPAFSEVFDLRVLVTDKQLYDDIRKFIPKVDSAFVADSERNREAVAAAIDEARINLLVSVQYKWILPRYIIDKVGGFAFNLHNAKLPNYKGYNSISHAILNQDQTYFSTVHWMIERVDEGEIAYTGNTPIEPADTAASLYLRTIPSAMAAFSQLLSAIQNGKEVPRVKAQGESTFYKRNSLAMFRDVTKVTDSEELERRVRAVFFPPYEPAFIRSAERKIYLMPSEAYPTIPDAWFAANRPKW